MKHLFYSTLAIIVIACSCSGGDASGITKAVGSPDYDYRTDWAKHGLLGTVRSVQAEYFAMNFSSKGKLDDNDSPTTKFKGRKRIDSGYSGYAEYTFDDLGRLILQEAPGYSAKFTYEGDNFYPAIKEEEYEDDYDGSTQTATHTYEYKAKDFDEKGNWLVRTDNGETETRSITYWIDPYEMKDAPKYNSPKEVANAMFKAQQKLDAKAYLGTMRYRDRKLFELTEEACLKQLQGSKENGDGIRSYKLGEVEMRNENEADVHVTIVETDGTIGHWAYRVIKDSDGYWYNGIIGGKIND